MRVTDEIGLDIRVDRLSVSRGGGPVREGVFGIDARVDADRVNLFVPHESTGEQGGVTHAYEPVYLHISGDAGQILIDGNGQPTDADREPITLVARVESFAAEDGSRLVMAAGHDSTAMGNINDLFVLDLATNRWREITEVNIR